MHMGMASPILKKVAFRPLTMAPAVAMTLSGSRDSSLTELYPRPLRFPSFIKGVPPHWRNAPLSVRLFVPFEQYLNDMRVMQRRVQKALERMETMMQDKKFVKP